MRRPGTLLILVPTILLRAQSVLEPGRGWEQFGGSFQLTADSAVDKSGNVYFTDARKNRIWTVSSEGTVSVWKEKTGGTHGIAMGPDGRLYAGQHDRKRIVAYTPNGAETVVAEGVQTHHLKVTQRNEVYFSDAPNHRIWLLDAAGRRRVATSEVHWPHGLRVSADGSRLIVTDSQNGDVWTFQIQADGSLKNGSRFFRLRIPGTPSEIDAGGVDVDRQGYAYIATQIGVQVFEPSGRLTEVIEPPGADGVTDVFFAGSDFAWLYVTDGSRIYRRPVERRGVSR